MGGERLGGRGARLWSQEDMGLNSGALCLEHKFPEPIFSSLKCEY